MNEKGYEGILCYKVKDLPVPTVPAYRVQCAGCSEDLWVSKRLREEHPLVPCFCAPCVQAQADGPIQAEVSPEALAELMEKGLSEGEIEWAEKEVNRRIQEQVGLP